MDRLEPNDLKSLIAQQGKRCVSLYMPTYRVGTDQQQNPIRLKNMLADVESKLLASGLRRPEVEEIVRPAQDLLLNNAFWKQQGNGLAIFLSEESHAIYRLPVECEELLVIADRFHVKPLLPALHRGGKIYILGVSLNKVRLFEAGSDSIKEIAFNFPTSMEDALWMDEPEKYLNLHPGSVRTRDAGIFHGHGMEDDDKKNILRFLHAVDDGLNALIEDKTTPLVLAGVDYLLPLYREVSTYQNILHDSVTGNPDRESLDDLQKQAWNIAEPLFEESQKKAYEKFEQLRGQQSDLAITDLGKAVKAATFGQVESMFVSLNKQVWGRYDAGKNEVLFDKEPNAKNQDLLDLAATQTLLNSGQVFAVSKEQIPGRGDLAVVLRYAVPIP